MIGDDALQPVGSMSHFVALCKCLFLCFPFFFFFFLYARQSLNEQGGFAVAMASELSTGLRNWRQCWGPGGSVSVVVRSRPRSPARHTGCMQCSLSRPLPTSYPGWKSCWTAGLFKYFLQVVAVRDHMLWPSPTLTRNAAEAFPLFKRQRNQMSQYFPMLWKFKHVKGGVRRTDKKYT